MSTSQVNITESITKGWLIKKKSWFDKIETPFCVFVLLWFPFATILLLFSNEVKNQNDKVFGIISIVFSIISLFGCYRKIVENKLISIDSKFSVGESKERLINFLEKEGLEVKRKSGSLVIAYEIGTLSFNETHIKVYTFIIHSNKIYFTIVRENFRINFPVFFYHYFLKQKLSKFLS